MNTSRLGCIMLFFLLSGCAHQPPEEANIATLKDKPIPQVTDSQTAIDFEATLNSYRIFLEAATDGSARREALRRLADVELEIAERLKSSDENINAGRAEASAAIDLYSEYLSKYGRDDNDERVFYQLAKAYDLIGQAENSLSILETLLHQYPNGIYEEEALFRSGEIFFSLRNNAAAEQAFKTIADKYPNSLFYERALYMEGWTLYLQNRYEETLGIFFSLLDRKLVENSLEAAALSESIPRADRELLEDSLKVICLALSYQESADPVVVYFSNHGDRPYEPLIHRRLGEFYLDKERYLDAAHAFLGLTRNHPDHVLAPEFHQYAINAYKAGGFINLYADAESDFVKSYGIDSGYWKSHDESYHERMRPLLSNNIRELSAHYHGIARRSHSTSDFDMAVKWYKEYIKTFPSGPETAEMNFLLAECLYDANHYEEAITEYERTAYQYDTHKYSAESAYAAILGYQKIIANKPEIESTEWRYKSIDSSQRFSATFPDDKRAPSVLAKTVDELYALKDYARTIDSAQRFLSLPDQGNNDFRGDVCTLLGHAQFESGDYIDAEKSYQTALNLLMAGDPRRAKIVENMAASIYKQGDQRRAEGDLRGAITLFLSVEKVAPAPSIWVSAQYDAAAALIQLEDWVTAATVLEDFRRRSLGNAEMQHGVTEKLALVYMKKGQKQKAALEMEKLAVSESDETRRRDLLSESAASFQEVGDINSAIRLYERYVKEFPLSIPEGIEARNQLGILYAKLGKVEISQFWLKEIVKADRAAGTARTDRTRQLASQAMLNIAQPQLLLYQKAKLTLPLEKSLNFKKSLMEKVISTYTKALEYHVADVTTAATYQLGNVYSDFAKAILSSERPHQLSAEELEQYNTLLEEQAFAFEEKAIKLHEANVQHISDGIYDKWIMKSLDALSALYPVRYAKTEASEAYFDAIQ